MSGSRSADSATARSPLPAALRPLTVPASRVYGALIAARNRRFDRGQGVQRIDRPVISIGNLTTGGTGKTPMVTWIAREMLAAGHHPVIAMRGYKARPGQLSDEQAEYGELLPDVPVVANPDRIMALREFLPQHPEVDCVLLDDGFQHRQLHRDLDLVLIDAEAGTLRDELLPAGNLREELGGLRRAHGVIVTHAKNVDADLARDIERWHGRPPIAWARHKWKGLYSPLPLREGLGVRAGATQLGDLDAHNDAAAALTPALSQRERESVPLEWLRDKRMITMLGIGKPASVIAQVESHGAKIMANIPASDHEHYDRAKLMTARGLCDGCDAMVVTLKDWVKMRSVLASMKDRWPVPIVVPALELEVFDGAEALRRMVVDAALRGAPAVQRPAEANVIR